ncbi:MAG: M16 family metallopeptidase [Thiotrichales bacterium]
MQLKNFTSLAALTLSLGIANATPGEGVQSFELDNGMKVLVQPDHRAPVAVSQVWYRVGASDEYSGITGLSHLLEHMMFKGTKKHPSGDFSKIVSDNGGQDNAFTSQDYTAYYQFLGADRIEISFELEADRMRNLVLQQDEFEKELEVVKEERLMRTDDNPEALTYERFNAAAFFNSPYHAPVVGWMEDLEALELADLQNWYRRYYAPNNATLVVVGDVEPEKIFKLAKKHFGKLKPSVLTSAKPRRETEQHGERRIKVHAPSKLPYVLVGYHVPVLKTATEEWEPYALDVLAGILDGGRSSRLSRELVREQEIAAAASAGYRMTSRYDGLFLLDANPAEGHSVAEVEVALNKELERLKQELVTAEELQRVKAQVIASDVYQLDSVRHRANQIGALETVGLGWELLDIYPQKIKAVTAEQIQAVARKYFVEQHRSVAELVPVDVPGPGA